MVQNFTDKLDLLEIENLEEYKNDTLMLVEWDEIR
jgi:hypothetical protein